MVSAVVTALADVPVTKRSVFVWLAGALVIVGVTRNPWRARLFAVDWFPFLLVMVSYDRLRAVIAGSGISPHVTPMMRFDRFVGLGNTPTVWLQRHFFDPHHLRWYDYSLWLVYLSHFVAPLAIAVALWFHNRERFRQYAVRVIALSYAAFATYFVFPAVPPWMASEQRHIATALRTQKAVWAHFGVHQVESLVSGGSNLVNNVAAVPSLHAAFPALICLFFWPRASRPWRVFLVAYVFSMGFALVYGAEHWVFDILLGWLYAIAVTVIASRVGERRARRRAEVTGLIGSERYAVDGDPDEPNSSIAAAS